MDCINLLAEAHELGLNVSANGDQLVIRGPKSAGHIAEALISRKQEIMNLLSQQELKPIPERGSPHQHADSVFGPPPRHIQHKDPICESLEFWRHRWGGFYCSSCWPCTDLIMQVATDNKPIPMPESQQPKSAAEWTAEETELVDWLIVNYDDLIDQTDDFQHQIDIAGVTLVLRRGPAARRARQTVSDLKILKRDKEEFSRRDGTAT